MNPTRKTRRAPRRSVAQWQALIERFERAGQTRKRFCAAHGVALSTFDGWRRKLRGTPAVREEESQALFVELSSPPEAEVPVPVWDVELELGGGVVLRVRRAVPC